MRYNKTDISTTERGKQYYKAKQYPSIPPKNTDIYIITVVGDRLDLLAHQYYKDASLWWVISMANGNLDSMFPEPGTQLRIPVDLNFVMNLFEKNNTK
jgi:nucleoid-associated protein YgaU